MRLCVELIASDHNSARSASTLFLRLRAETVEWLRAEIEEWLRAEIEEQTHIHVRART